MHIRQLSVELQKKAEDELNEVPGRVQDDLKYIKEWLKSQKHIKARTDDQWLLAFLRGCKFSLEKTKIKLDTFYTMRTIVPEFFSNRDPFLPEIQEALIAGAFWIPLPKTADSAGPRVLIMSGPSFDPNKIKVVTAVKLNLMVMDILINEDDNFCVAGHHTLQDLKELQMEYVFQMSPSFLNKALTCLHQAYPGKPKGFHCINAPAISETIFSIIKSFLNSKIKNRINVRSNDDCSNIHKDVPISVLPKDFGGDGGSLEQLRVLWKKKIENYSDWFKEDAAFRSDESKRPSMPKTSADVFGIEGSFRKLNVD